jgi:hypothetical protein
MALGLASAVALCGAVAAKPPLGPIPEGRELDPVTRDYYLVPQPKSEGKKEASGSSRAPETANLDAIFLAVALGVHDTLMSESTIPLGRARAAGM